LKRLLHGSASSYEMGAIVTSITQTKGDVPRVLQDGVLLEQIRSTVAEAELKGLLIENEVQRQDIEKLSALLQQNRREMIEGSVQGLSTKKKALIRSGWIAAGAFKGAVTSVIFREFVNPLVQEIPGVEELTKGAHEAGRYLSGKEDVEVSAEDNAQELEDFGKSVVKGASELYDLAKEGLDDLFGGEDAIAAVEKIEEPLSEKFTEVVKSEESSSVESPELVTPPKVELPDVLKRIDNVTYFEESNLVSENGERLAAEIGVDADNVRGAEIRAMKRLLEGFENPATGEPYTASEIQETYREQLKEWNIKIGGGVESRGFMLRPGATIQLSFDADNHAHFHIVATEDQVVQFDTVREYHRGEDGEVSVNKGDAQYKEVGKDIWESEEYREQAARELRRVATSGEVLKELPENMGRRNGVAASGKDNFAYEYWVADRGDDNRDVIIKTGSGTIIKTDMDSLRGTNVPAVGEDGALTVAELPQDRVNHVQRIADAGPQGLRSPGAIADTMEYGVQRSSVSGGSGTRVETTNIPTQNPVFGESVFHAAASVESVPQEVVPQQIDTSLQSLEVDGAASQEGSQEVNGQKQEEVAAEVLESSGISNALERIGDIASLNEEASEFLTKLQSDIKSLPQLDSQEAVLASLAPEQRMVLQDMPSSAEGKYTFSAVPQSDGGSHYIKIGIGDGEQIHHDSNFTFSTNENGDLMLQGKVDSEPVVSLLNVDESGNINFVPKGEGSTVSDVVLQESREDTKDSSSPEVQPIEDAREKWDYLEKMGHDAESQKVLDVLKTKLDSITNPDVNYPAQQGGIDEFINNSLNSEEKVAISEITGGADEIIIDSKGSHAFKFTDDNGKEQFVINENITFSKDDDGNTMVAENNGTPYPAEIDILESGGYRILRLDEEDSTITESTGEASPEGVEEEWDYHTELNIGHDNDSQKILDALKTKLDSEIKLDALTSEEKLAISERADWDGQVMIDSNGSHAFKFIDNAGTEHFVFNENMTFSKDDSGNTMVTENNGTTYPAQIDISADGGFTVSRVSQVEG
jgi:hypothetical protein